MKTNNNHTITRKEEGCFVALRRFCFIFSEETGEMCDQREVCLVVVLILTKNCYRENIYYFLN